MTQFKHKLETTSKDLIDQEISAYEQNKQISSDQNQIPVSNEPMNFHE